MSQRLDETLRSLGQSASVNPTPGAALTGALGEPPRPWKREFLKTAVVLTVTFVLSAIGAFVADKMTMADLPLRLRTVLPLFALGLVSAWAAVAPRARWKLVLSTVLGLFCVVGVVVTRDPDAAGPMPHGWFCFTTQLAVGALPLLVGLLALRRAALTQWRAAIGGLSFGTAGAILGEMACGLGWQHVAIFHVGAWVMIVALTVIIAMKMKPDSYAP